MFGPRGDRVERGPMKKTLLAALLLCSPALLAREGEKAAPEKKPENPVAVVTTSMGEIHLELFAAEAPKTVKNFIGLAEGTKEFKDPKTGETVSRPFYDGLVFHRVIKDFMIQGGCPQGNGTGGPGYSFEDEMSAKSLGLSEMKAFEGGRPHKWLTIGMSQRTMHQKILSPTYRKLEITSQEDLNARRGEVEKALAGMTLEKAYTLLGYRYDNSRESHSPKKGVIAMANSGPNTNGSQFFINLGDTPHLTGKHTVFGKVVKGMDVVERIGEVEVDSNSKPTKPVKIVTVRRPKK